MIEGQDGLTKAARLTCAMAGGGRGAFIGDVHRKALAFDGKAELVAGCFSQSPDNTIETGEALGLSRDRLYPSAAEMIAAESRRPDRPDFLVIATPNDSHFALAQAALKAGFHVVCEKPLATSSADAEALLRLAEERDRLFMVAYAYRGYPMVFHMREMIRRGDLGDIRFVAAEYPQDWLAGPLETTGQKQAAWRTDPKRAGLSNCVGDIGSHIENMVSYLTCLEMESLLARLDTFGPGRVLDDNASILVRFKGGAEGMFWSSQIAVGNDNGFRVRVFGTKGSVDWFQEEPNSCTVGALDKPTVRLSRGRDPMLGAGRRLSRIPSGHPEGYFEAFANLYSLFLDALAGKRAGRALTPEDLDFPGAADGLRGVRFIERCVESSSRGAAWVKF